MQHPDLTLMILRSRRVTPRRTTVLTTAMRTPRRAPLVSDRLRSFASRALIAAAARVAPAAEPAPFIDEMPAAAGVRNA